MTSDVGAPGLIEAIRTTGTCRRFSSRPVPDKLLFDALDAARFAPQGGNRQPVSWLFVRDAAKKQQLGGWYRPIWRQYLARQQAPQEPEQMSPRQRAANRFADSFGSVPIIAVVCVDVAGLEVTDAELDRQSIVGGASVYPFVQNFCLAMRAVGVATAITTMLVPREQDVRQLLAIPENFITAAHVAVGFPERAFPTKLNRKGVGEFAYLDTYGAALSAS